MDFKLIVDGVGTDLVATLVSNGEEIATNTVSSGKDAEKWATAVATNWKQDTTPEPVIRYTKTFTL